MKVKAKQFELSFDDQAIEPYTKDELTSMIDKINSVKQIMVIKQDYKAASALRDVNFYLSNKLAELK